MRRCDVLIIGGGPAGATAAILLARAGRSVVLLEKSRFPRAKVCGEFIAPAGIARLRELGLGERLDDAGGPEIRRIALWAGASSFEAAMPQLRAPRAYPRALEREKLDAWLLERAAQCGAEVIQPATALELKRTATGMLCRAAERRGAAEFEIEARAAIAAHGSWEPGGLATQARHLAPSPADLLAFKAHFVGALPPRTIVLMPFRGGYAGLVERRGGRVTFACCVRRDALERLRTPGISAGESVFRHCMEERVSLSRESAWLAAGPLRPGARPLWHDGLFAIGNAAGEAHPVVGEGITIALHSAALLSVPLAAALEAGYSARAERAVAREYARCWRRSVAFRLWMSARLADVALRAPPWAEALLGRAPALLTVAARLSGKGWHSV